MVQWDSKEQKEDIALVLQPALVLDGVTTDQVSERVADAASRNEHMVL